MSITVKIDNILKTRNMSRRQLAIKAGIPPSSFQSAMDRGKNLTIDMLQAISSALDLPINYFFSEDETLQLATDVLERITHIIAVLSIVRDNENTPDTIKRLIISQLPNDNIELLKRQLFFLAVQAKENSFSDLYAEFHVALNCLNRTGKKVALERLKELAMISYYQESN